MAGSPNVGGVIPFTGAALPYREQFYSQTWTPTTSAQNVSPSGNAIKSYGFARALRVYTSTTGGGGGNFAADAPWSAPSPPAAAAKLASVGAVVGEGRLRRRGG
jgi:hypothetical protein